MAASAPPEPAADTPVCPVEGHAAHRIRKKGRRATSAGETQRYECVAADGARHTFSMLADAKPDRPKPRKLPCPNPAHADSRVRARGLRTTKAGTWRRYRCERPDGSKHDFQVLEGQSGSVLTSLTRPPACSEHPGSAVTRHGPSSTLTPRQRYRCVPVDGTPHTFTPALPREKVHVGTDACATCDELLSPHRGTQAAARAASWSLPAIVRALNELSLGASYASTSLLMREHRDLTRKHLLEAHGIGGMLAAEMTEPGGTYAGGEGKKAWHLAADLVEQYAPLVWVVVEPTMRERAAAHREANDEILANHPDAALHMPLTWVLDEVPIYVKRRNPTTGRRELTIWTVHVVVEIEWLHSGDPKVLPTRRNRLRLVRAYPRGNADTWRLVFGELGIRPDVIVADCGESIAGGIKATYGDGNVAFIPSMYHLRKNLDMVLRKQPKTTVKVEGRNRLLDVFAKPLDLLNKDDVRNMAEEDIREWWDLYLRLLADRDIPTGSIVQQRRAYEERMVQAVPLLRSHPHLPASNAAVENRIRVALDPFLANRKQMYRNLARTNFLFDLAVARDQGAFVDLDRLMRLIRDDNVGAGGWARQARTLDDPQPDPKAPGYRGPYASLLNPVVVPALLEHRQIKSWAEGSS